MSQAPDTEVDRLRRRLAEIEACVRAFAVVGGTFDLDELLLRAMRSAQEVMNAEASSIMLRDEATGDLIFRTVAGAPTDAGARAALRTVRIPKGHGIAGWVVEHGEPALVTDAQTDPRHYHRANEGTGFRTRNLIAAPLMSADRVTGVAEVLNKREGTFDEEDLRSFLAYAALVSSAIEAARLHRRIMSEELGRRELEMAHRIQDNLQGPAEASVPGARFAGVSVPARDVGGDLFDFLSLGDGHVGILVGDVSGKGVPAALLMANVLSRFRAKATRDPSETLAEMNRGLCAATARGLFVTVAYHVLETATGTLRWAAAGHPPGVVWRAVHADVETLPPAPAPPIGILPTMTFPSGETRLWPGDVLVTVTDGVSEARSPEREEFGTKRVSEILDRTATAGASPAAIAAEIVEAVSTFAGGETGRDDLTVAILRAEVVPAAALEPVRIAVRACPEALGAVRAEAERFCRRAGLDSRTAGQVVLALDEACANVVRHGYVGGGGAMEITFEHEAGLLRLRVEDRARPFAPRDPPVIPDATATSGRGLGIIHAVMDEVRFEPGETGTTLRMTKRVGPAAA